MSVYSHPDDFGLRLLGEAEVEPCYDYDKFVAWERVADGRVLIGTDSGCSCPSPFEDQGVAALAEIGSYEEFDRALIYWMQDRSRAIQGEAEIRTAVLAVFTVPREHRENERALVEWRVRHIGLL